MDHERRKALMKDIEDQPSDDSSLEDFIMDHERRKALMKDIEDQPSDDSSLEDFIPGTQPKLKMKKKRDHATKHKRLSPRRRRQPKVNVKKNWNHATKDLAEMGPSRISKRLSPRRRKRPIKYSN
jgi:hypothetical protein